MKASKNITTAKALNTALVQALGHVSMTQPCRPTAQVKSSHRGQLAEEYAWGDDNPMEFADHGVRELCF
jgi:hypothetical protein